MIKMFLIIFIIYSIAITLFALWDNFDWARRYKWLSDDWDRYCTRRQKEIMDQYTDKLHQYEEIIKVYQQRELKK